MRPGLTGWAQVNGRNAVSWEEKLDFDVWYVENLSLALDLRILARTIVVALTGRGVSAVGHATMPEFMGKESSADRIGGGNLGGRETIGKAARTAEEPADEEPDDRRERS